MCLVHKIKRVKNSESGFVLIAALMGIIILLAVGFLALTITTGDMKIASRLIGERKAFSAAETGVHELCRIFNWQAPLQQATFTLMQQMTLRSGTAMRNRKEITVCPPSPALAMI
jgi:Tfp pilus assembly protein PilX